MKNRNNKISILIFLTVVFFAKANAQFNQVNTNEQIAVWANDYMRNAVKFDHFSGTVLIARNGKPFFRKAYGMANYEMAVPNDINTKFRIGSISKQFTAAAIMQLQERGKLNVNDLACKYLDRCSEAWKAITIKQLLNHTSGLVNFTSLQSAQGNFLTVPHTHSEIVDTFRDLPLDSEPGEKYNYNNSDYYLLGMIIEKVSGTKYAEYLRKSIYTPLGMRNTDFDDQKTIVKHKALSYYLGSDFVFRVTAYTNMNTLFSIGGLYSTVDDLLIWERAFSTGQLLSRSSIEEMFSPGKGNYGYGWWIDKVGNCSRMYHDGGISNFSSSLQRLPELGLTIIAISSRGDDGGIRATYDLVGKICGSPATIRGIQPELETLSAQKLYSIVMNARAKFTIFDIQESQVEEIGNYLMLTKQHKQAIEVFQLNTMLYPQSPKCYLKLAMAFESINNTLQAIKSFKQSLNLDPTNTTAAEHLRKLEIAPK